MELSERIVNAVMDAVMRAGLVEVEVSARHVHLSREDFAKLFGDEAELHAKRPLSQPGEFLAEERVAIVGAKGRKERTAVLGPFRKTTQVELSKSDCVELGVQAPLRLSGDTAGSGSVTIEGPRGSITIAEGAIVAHNHVHLTPEAASSLGIADREHVDVEIFTERPLIFRDVIVRVSEKFNCRMHVDFDEANAALINGFTLGRISKRGARAETK